MQQNTEVNKLAAQLAARLHGITLGSSMGVFGASDREVALIGLRRAAAEFVQAGHDGSGAPLQRTRLEAIESALQSAQLVGLLSDAELRTYLQAVDDLYDLTDKEL